MSTDGQKIFGGRDVRQSNWSVQLSATIQNIQLGSPGSIHLPTYTKLVITTTSGPKYSF